MKDNAGIAMSEGESIALEQVQMTNDNMAKSHYHTYFELYYLEEGTRYHVVEDMVCCLNPKNFILFPPYVMHHSYSDKDVGFKRTLIYFTKAMISDSQIFSILSKNVWQYGEDDGEEILKLMYEIMKEQEKGDSYSQKYIYFLLNQILVKLVRKKIKPEGAEGEARIMNAIGYLHKNYANKITLDELSTRFFVSKYYLCHEFKRYTNCTIIQYINNLRVSHAQKLLEETDKSITEISMLVGFPNVTHFNRVFRLVTGKSPTQSRKLLRKGRTL